MTATYDNTLSSNRDHVRFLIGDTDISSAKLSDEEIDAVILEESGSVTGIALKYFAAASCLSALHSRWLGSGNGLVEKEVDDLRLKWGVDNSSSQTILSRISELKKMGSFYMRSRPRAIKIMMTVLVILVSICYGQAYAQEASEGDEDSEVSNSSNGNNRFSRLVAAGWCQVVSKSDESNVNEDEAEDLNTSDISDIGCDVGMGLRLMQVRQSISLVTVVGMKSAGLGLAYTVFDSENSTMSYSIAVGLVCPYDSSGFYYDEASMAIGTTIGF